MFEREMRGKIIEECWEFEFCVDGELLILLQCRRQREIQVKSFCSWKKVHLMVFHQMHLFSLHHLLFSSVFSAITHS